MKESIVTPFAPILVESTRSIGYSFEAAVADIIDNSISAKAKKINVYFSPFDEPYICVIDNGLGMDSNTLEQAMRYGSQSPDKVRSKSDLGRFGLGMKMASLSQCRKLTVVSKKNNMINACQWDLDIIKEKKDWVLISYNEKEINEFPHIENLKDIKSGTLVIWQDFDKLKALSSGKMEKIFDEKNESTKDHIALVFHRYISGDGIINRVKILVNDYEIIANDPFLKKHKATQALTEQTIKIKNEVIKVKPFILPHYKKLKEADYKLLGGKDDLKKNQGFYIYRNKRLILYGTWFQIARKEELSKLARIRVDIPNTLDHIWQIDVRKSTASLPLKIRKSLISIMDNIVGSSKRVYTYRGRKTKKTEIGYLWEKIKLREGVQYSLNREHPILGLIYSTMEKEQIRTLNIYLDLLEEHFPYQDVYIDIAKGHDTNYKKAKKEGEDELYDIACEIFKNADLMNMNNSEVIESLKKKEPFCEYPRLIERLIKKYQIGE